MGKRTENGERADTPVDAARLAMPLGEAIFTQRSIRRFRADPIPMDDLRLILEAAAKAPSGGNRQPARFLVVTDRDLIRELGPLYHEAWWAKRRDEGRPWTTREAIPPEERGMRSSAQLADEIKDAPCVILALSVAKGQASNAFWKLRWWVSWTTVESAMTAAWHPPTQSPASRPAGDPHP